MIRLTPAPFLAFALASCIEDDPAMKDCLRQFTETECACLKEAIPEEKWRALDVMAQGKGLSTRSRATALSLRAKRRGSAGRLSRARTRRRFKGVGLACDRPGCCSFKSEQGAR